MSDGYNFIPPRATVSDEERRLHEAIDRQAGQLLATLDAAIRLRTAPQDAKAVRQKARGHLLDFCLKAMHAQALTGAEAKKP